MHYAHHSLPEPIPMTEPAAATIAASPPELPPTMCSVLYGFLDLPYTQLLVSHHMHNSLTFVDASSIAPASSIFCTTTAFSLAMIFLLRTKPPVCTNSLKPNASLHVNGTPYKTLINNVIVIIVFVKDKQTTWMLYNGYTITSQSNISNTATKKYACKDIGEVFIFRRLNI